MVQVAPALRRRAASALAALLVAVTGPASAADFDFYVLALSWSPTHCATDDDPSEEQCGVDRGFVVHGLWPQHERGYPTDCDSEHPLWLEQDVIDDHRDIFPDGGLAIHQWRKHGRCSGLSQEDYFDLVREARRRVTVPRAFRPGDTDKRATPANVEVFFVNANDGLSEDAMSVQCDGRLLSEVRICLTKDLDFRACREVDADACRAPNVVVPDIR